MHGLLTVLLVWQFLPNFGRPASLEIKKKNLWKTSGFPPTSPLPRQSQIKYVNGAGQTGGYDSRKLYERRLLGGKWIEYPIVVITDQDEHSSNPKEPGLFVSTSIHGYLRFNLQTKNFTLQWMGRFNYTSNLNSKGRGMELSDLKVFNGKLYTADDKTSVVFQLTNSMAIPWTIEAAFKVEWLTVKGEELYVGGYGKEFTDGKGNWVNNNPLWIKVIDRFGRVRHVNWTREFKAIRNAIGIEYPAYLIHESCQWSDVHHKWFFLPRKVSFEAYNEKKDPYKAGNYLIMADEKFEHFESIRIGTAVHPTHGFSAFQFVPGTNDTVIIAIKSEELENSPFLSFYTVFNINGSIYMDETNIPGNYKIEGLEFVDWTKEF